MTRLPEKGDVKAACDRLDARVKAISGGGSEIHCGPISITGGKMVGDIDPLLQAYGDLFDPAEFMTEVGALLITVASADVAAARMTQASALSSILLHAVALGTLMERQRWQS